jgi:altronate dehydratase large subunit
MITWSSGYALPYGFPFVPVIKITANRDHFHKYPDILDYLVDIDTALTHLDEVGAELLDLIVEIASGRRTQNEIIGYTGTCDLWTIAPAA